MVVVKVNGYTIKPGADLTGADLAGADLQGVNFTGFEYNEFNSIDEGAPREIVILRGANLRGANLRDSRLYGVDLSGADLTEADMRETHLAGANLEGACLVGADLGESWDEEIGDFYFVNLAYANLAGANLAGANLTSCDFGGANLRGANLSGANLSGAEFTFLGDDSEMADLKGANLTGSFADEKTVWPLSVGWKRFSPEMSGVLFGNPLVLSTDDMKQLDGLDPHERRVRAPGLEEKARERAAKEAARRGGTDVSVRIPKDADDFEAVCAEWMQKAGLPDAQRTPKGPDGGIDTIASDAVGQAKFHPSQKVTGESVRALVGSKIERKKKRALFFHYGPGYTPDAIEAARKTGVELYQLDVDKRRFKRIDK